MVDYPWEVNFFGLLCIFLYLKLLSRVCIYVLFGYEKKYSQWSIDIPLSFQLCVVLREKTERALEQGAVFKIVQLHYFSWSKSVVKLELLINCEKL